MKKFLNEEYQLELSNYFRSIIDQDRSAIVICNVTHEIIYMNPAAISRYGSNLTGKSLMECHRPDSCEKILQCLSWFQSSSEHNLVYESRNEKENKDVYMVALRNGEELIGYYEKHEYRSPETMQLYDLE